MTTQIGENSLTRKSCMIPPSPTSHRVKMILPATCPKARQQMQLSQTFHALQYSTDHQLSKKVKHAYISMNSGITSLIMVQFSIRNHHWKAKDLSYTAAQNGIFTKSFHTSYTYQHLVENRNLCSILLSPMKVILDCELVRQIAHK